MSGVFISFGMLADVHCHLEDRQFDSDLAQVIERAKKAAVAFVICNGTDKKSNEKVLSISEKFNIVKSALGLFPAEAEKMPEDKILEEISFIEKNKDKIVAIGEIGLDYHYTKDPDFIKKQKFALTKLVELAEKIKKPVILHSRKAEQDVFDILQSSNVKNAVFHCFTGKISLAKKIAEAGFYFSIPANIIFSPNLQELVKAVDINQLLTETDSPLLSPFRGKRNEPAFVTESVKKIAELKKINVKEAEDILFKNAKNLFRLQ
ncbi:YchF/TatD family DNA exonuclease [Candidatus Woesearchaeota archaeon]|nr:YchF/TatD family DNA exonuclease [Candidatus Woesearchaeota archaeon]